MAPCTSRAKCRMDGTNSTTPERKPHCGTAAGARSLTPLSAESAVEYSSQREAGNHFARGHSVRILTGTPADNRPFRSWGGTPAAHFLEASQR